MHIDWLSITLGVLVGLAYFGLIGGVAGALVGGGREDRSIPVNAAIGLLGALVGGFLWALISGEEFVLGSGGVPAALAGSVLVLVLRRREEAMQM